MANSWTRQLDYRSIQTSENEEAVEPDHGTERGRATPVANAGALGRQRRSVLPFGVIMQPTATHGKLARVCSIGAALSLVFAVAGGAYFYPSTYAQPDFGYSFGVMLTVGCAVLLSLIGLCLAIAAICLSKAASRFLWFLCAANTAFCIGVPLIFKLKYVPNQPLHRNTVQRSSFDAHGFSDAGFAASSGFQRQSVI